MLYLSFVNVGQTFYGFGWETLLCEVGFFTIFAGAGRTAPNMWLIWIWRWMLFRLMFGAGLIKLRGDPCWRDLTCLNYYFETQPMPNALSWYFHWMPHGVHTAGVVFNHIVELIVPFAYFAPQPFAVDRRLVTILFQGVLIVSRQPVVAELADARAVHSAASTIDGWRGCRFIRRPSCRPAPAYSDGALRRRPRWSRC